MSPLFPQKPQWACSEVHYTKIWFCKRPWCIIFAPDKGTHNRGKERNHTRIDTGGFTQTDLQTFLFNLPYQSIFHKLFINLLQDENIALVCAEHAHLGVHILQVPMPLEVWWKVLQDSEFMCQVLVLS